MAHIEKRKRKDGSTAYHCEVNKQGFKRVKRVFDTLAAANVWADGIENQIAAGRHDIADPRMTFNQLLTLVEPKLGKSTYVAALEYWRSEIGPLRVSRITPVLIDQHRDALLGAPCQSHLQKTTRPRSPQTVWHYIQQLSRIFSVAVQDLHMLTENPIKVIRRPKLPKGRKRFLSDDEIARLLAASKASDSKSLYGFVLLLLTTGCRRGEAYAMKWTDIDVEAKHALLPVTKSGEPRIIPFTQAVLDALMALPRDDSGLVFPNELTKAWHTAIKRAKINNFRLHDVRHTSASLLVRAGHSLFDVGALLGHADPRTTKRYAHVAQGTTAKMVNRVMRKLK